MKYLTTSLAVLLLAVIAGPLSAQMARPERVLPEYERSSVVLIAFAEEDARFNRALSDVMETVLGQSIPSLREVQIDIAMKAAKANPVVILVPDDEMKLRVLEDCDDVGGLCEYLDSGRITVEVVPHEGAWVRDYGPMFRSTARGPVVVHAPYHDARQDVQKREKLTAINRRRLSLLEDLSPNRNDERGLDVVLDRLRQQHKNESDDEETPDADLAEKTSPSEDAAEKPKNDVTASTVRPHNAADDSALGKLEALLDQSNGKNDEKRKRLIEQLHYLDELYAATEKQEVQRTLDEEAAPIIGITLLAKGNVPTEKVAIDIDGGNLLPMPDGRCITTRGLLTRNPGRQTALEEVLRSKYGCTEPIYLYPLAGGVIEHVDMFVLPAGDKRVFLASFNPNKEVLKPYWQKLNGGMTRIALESAIAMAENARMLREKGYSVIEVPALFPREIPLPPGVFYPTMLNGLVQKGEDGKMQFLIPIYGDYEPEVQAAALASIKSTLGPTVDVETIEATAAAIEQGAVHCLTLLVPQEWTRWGDPTSRSLRDQMVTMVQKLSKTRTEGLEGIWHLELPEGDKDKELFTILDPKLIFRQKRLRFQYGDASSGQHFDYKVMSKEGDTWTLKVDNDTMKVVWKGPTRFELVDDENHAMIAVRK